MTKKIKRNILLNPGPATTSDTVKRAMVVPDICPRETEFKKLMSDIRKQLVWIVKGGREYSCVLFAGSGTAGVEACINSVVPRGKKILIINNGAYGKRMVEIAQAYRIGYVEIRFQATQKPDVKKIEKILKVTKNVSCVAMVHHETTTGILNPLEEIGWIAKRFKCELIVDAISSFAGIPMNIKNTKVDYLISSSNKCIQGMAGVVFVICKRSALMKTRHYKRRSYYLNLFDQYENFEKCEEMRFTPPVQVLYALKQAIKEYESEGGMNRYKRYTENWKTLREGLIKLGFELLLDESLESHILLTVKNPKDKNFSFKILHDLLYLKGFTIYPGKIYDQKTFRLANMGAINKDDMRAFLKALKRSLKKMKSGQPALPNYS